MEPEQARKLRGDIDRGWRGEGGPRIAQLIMNDILSCEVAIRLCSADRAREGATLEETRKIQSAVAVVQQWYVGPGQQPDAMLHGYTQAVEDDLFRHIEWPTYGYQLFDIQQLTAHSRSLGAITISRRDYLRRLAAALNQPATFGSIGGQ